MPVVGSLSNLLNMFANERTSKLTQGQNILQQVADLFGPGYGKGMEREALTGVNEDMISRGLGSTTRPVALSAGMRMKTEDIRRSRLAEALSAISQFLGQTAPTAPTISNLAMGTNQVLRSGMQPYIADGSVRSNALFSSMPMYSTPR